MENGVLIGKVAVKNLPDTQYNLITGKKMLTSFKKKLTSILNFSNIITSNFLEKKHLENEQNKKIDPASGVGKEENYGI